MRRAAHTQSNRADASPFTAAEARPAQDVPRDSEGQLGVGLRCFPSAAPWTKADSGWRPSRLTLLLVVCAAACATPSAMVSLDGQDPVFAAGRRSFNRSKERCFQAVLTTFQATGRGVDKQDREGGDFVSGSLIVYHATESDGRRLVEHTVTNKLYVKVTGDDARCEVGVVKLRVWDNQIEVQTRYASWIQRQLVGFLVGVENELNDPSGVPNRAGKSPGELPSEYGPTVTGSMDREVIRTIVRSHLGELRDCYYRDLSVQGKLAVQWAIGPQGAVVEAKVIKSDTGSDDLDRCVVGQVLGWVFPAPAGGGKAVVTYPFVFKAPHE
jgi:hypothetical protein